MLSRAILPLAKPNVLASAVRVGSLSAQRPRFYAKGAPYKLPDSIQPKETNAKKPKNAQQPEPQQNQHAAEQPEFETQAKPETDAPESSSTVSSTPIEIWNPFLLTKRPIARA